MTDKRIEVQHPESDDDDIEEIKMRLYDESRWFDSHEGEGMG